MAQQTATAKLNPTEKYYFVVCPVETCKTKINVAPKSIKQRRACRKCRTVFNFHLNLEEQRIGALAPTSQHPRTLTGIPYTVIATGPDADRAAQIEVSSNSVGSGSIDMNEIIYQVEKRVLAEIKSEVEQQISDTTPNAYHINIAGQSEINIQGDRHAAYEEVLEKMLACGKVALVGPPGSGKSSLARQIAEDLGKGFSFNSCTEGMSETHILGRMNLEGEYLPSAFIRNFEGTDEFEGGGIHLWDEFDAMDPNIGLAVNEALSNGFCAVPARVEKPTATMAKGFYQVAAMNTWGTGTQIEYSGRNSLDAATMDRFVGAIVFVDYDKDREMAIAQAGDCIPLLRAFWQIRKNVQEAKIRRPVSTRAIINAADIRAANPKKYTYRRLLDGFFAGWSDTDIAKATKDVDFKSLNEEAPATTSAAAANEAPEAPEAPEADPHVQTPQPAGVTPKCPRCESDMVLRQAKKGNRAGQKFWGCTKFGTRKCFGTVAYKEAS